MHAALDGRRMASCHTGQEVQGAARTRLLHKRGDPGAEDDHSTGRDSTHSTQICSIQTQQIQYDAGNRVLWHS